MKDLLGASPNKGNQGTTRGKEKTLLTSMGIEPTTSGLGGGSNPEVGRSGSNPEIVGSIPTEVKRVFSLPRVVP